jgi:hypothetical protein
MKKLNSLLILLITFLIFSCSSDISQPNGEEQTNKNSKLYKRTKVYKNGTLTELQEVFYNNSSNIESITLNLTGYQDLTFTVSYSVTNITGISSATDIVNPNGTDEIINYNNIVIGNNSIVLISDDNKNKLEIYHTGNYVDSTKLTVIQTPYSPYVLEQTFFRNSNNQLISNKTGGDIFEYSNFDSDKKLDPYGSVMEYDHGTFFMIFGLKVSKDNPLTAAYKFSGGGTYSNFLEYDQQGYVKKVSYNVANSNSNYSVHEYITQ